MVFVIVHDTSLAALWTLSETNCCLAELMANCSSSTHSKSQSTVESRIRTLRETLGWREVALGEEDLSSVNELCLPTNSGEWDRRVFGNVTGGNVSGICNSPTSRGWRGKLIMSPGDGCLMSGWGRLDVMSASNDLTSWRLSLLAVMTVEMSSIIGSRFSSGMMTSHQSAPRLTLIHNLHNRPQQLVISHPVSDLWC